MRPKEGEWVVRQEEGDSVRQEGGGDEREMELCKKERGSCVRQELRGN